MKKKTGPKRRFGAILLFLLFLSCLFSSCAEVSRNWKLEFDDVLPMLGADKEVVWNALGFGPEKIEPFVEGELEEYVFEHPVGGNDCNVCFTFSHGVFSGFQYTFESAQEVFSYATRLRQALGDRCGEPTTRTIGSDVQHRFDSVPDAGALSPFELYYEDWTPELDETQMAKMVGGVPVKRIDIRFSVYTLEEGGVISVRYSVVPAEEPVP